MIAYLVAFEYRDVLGRICEEIDSVWMSEANAVARRKQINGDPKSFPGMVADTRSLPIRDYGMSVAPTGKPGRAGKLTAGKAREIRARYADGESVKDLADEYGISNTTAYDCINRNIWTHA